MGTALAVLGGLLGLGGIATAVVLWIRSSLSNEVSLGQRDAALTVETARVTAIEAAAVKERAQRQSEFDAKAAAVTDSKSAAGLLRSQFAGSGSSKPS